MNILFWNSLYKLSTDTFKQRCHTQKLYLFINKHIDLQSELTDKMSHQFLEREKVWRQKTVILQEDAKTTRSYFLRSTFFGNCQTYDDNISLKLKKPSFVICGA